MKKNKERIYLRLCNELDVIFKEFNPCEFRDGKCRRARRDALTSEPSNEPSCCSNKCPQLGNNGCKTKNLMCKLFTCATLCSAEYTEYLELDQSLTAVKIKISRAGLYNSATHCLSTQDALNKTKRQQS